MNGNGNTYHINVFYETVAEGATVTVITPLAVTLDLAELVRRPGPPTGAQ